MAKKKSFAKVLVGVSVAAVAGKVVYDKFKQVKENYETEEKQSVDDAVKKYNSVATKKEIEIEDEVFEGCEIKSIASDVKVDLGLAVFEKDVYINFTSTASNVSIIVPDGVNVICDIENTISNINNTVHNSDEDGLHTLYIIGKAKMSNILVLSMQFYGDDDDFEDEDDSVDTLDVEESNEGANTENVDKSEKDFENEEL